MFKLNSPARLGGGWNGQDGGRGLVVVMTPPAKLGTSCPLALYCRTRRVDTQEVRRMTASHKSCHLLQFTTHNTIHKCLEPIVVLSNENWSSSCSTAAPNFTIAHLDCSHHVYRKYRMPLPLLFSYFLRSRLPPNFACCQTTIRKLLMNPSTMK